MDRQGKEYDVAAMAADPLRALTLHQPHSPPLHDVRPDSDHGSNSSRCASEPLPSDVAMKLNNVIDSLDGTKESIRRGRDWFLERSALAPALAEGLRDRVLGMDDSDSERQMHLVFLATDILFQSFSKRSNPIDLDHEAIAFKPVLGSMLARIYLNPQNKEINQSRLLNILEFWESKEIYDEETIDAFETQMIGGDDDAGDGHAQKE